MKLVVANICFISLMFSISISLGVNVEEMNKSHRSTCGIVLDLCIILDTSGSIKNTYYTNAIQALVNITNRLNTRHSVSYSLVHFANTSQFFKNTVNSENSKQNFIDKIKGLNYDNTRYSDTQIGLAVKYASSFVFNTVKDPFAPKVALIFTDGLFVPGGLYDIFNEIAGLKARGVEVYVIHISNQINYANGELLASIPTHTHIIDLHEYALLFDLINAETVQACDENAFAFVINYEE